LGTTSGFVAFLLSIDEPIKPLVDPKELIAKNGLEKQVENNIEYEKFIGEMCLEKEMDIDHLKRLLAHDECLEEPIEPLESPREKSMENLKAIGKELVKS
jgi:hypothetical protein